MSTKRTRTELGHHAAQFVKSNAHTFTNLPEPGESWYSREVDLEQRYIPNLRANEIIERLGVEFEDGEQLFKYQTTRKGYDAIQTFTEDSDRLLPCSDDSCPASGFINLGDSLECKYCGQIHDKSEVKL